MFLYCPSNEKNFPPLGDPLKSSGDDGVVDATTSKWEDAGLNPVGLLTWRRLFLGDDSQNHPTTPR